LFHDEHAVIFYHAAIASQTRERGRWAGKETCLDLWSQLENDAPSYKHLLTAQGPRTGTATAPVAIHLPLHRHPAGCAARGAEPPSRLRTSLRVATDLVACSDRLGHRLRGLTSRGLEGTESDNDGDTYSAPEPVTPDVPPPSPSRRFTSLQQPLVVPSAQVALHASPSSSPRARTSVPGGEAVAERALNLRACSADSEEHETHQMLATQQFEEGVRHFQAQRASPPTSPRGLSAPGGSGFAAAPLPTLPRQPPQAGCSGGLAVLPPQGSQGTASSAPAVQPQRVASGAPAPVTPTPAAQPAHVIATPAAQPQRVASSAPGPGPAGMRAPVLTLAAGSSGGGAVALPSLSGGATAEAAALAGRAAAALAARAASLAAGLGASLVQLRRRSAGAQHKADEVAELKEQVRGSGCPDSSPFFFYPSIVAAL
jgi:hypothetical protein